MVERFVPFTQGSDAVYVICIAPRIMICLNLLLLALGFLSMGDFIIRIQTKDNSFLITKASVEIKL